MAQMNRRNFLGAAAAGALALNEFLPRSSAADQAKLRLGVIGCGNYGMTDVRAAFKAGGVEIVALCDVDSQHLADGRHGHREDSRAPGPRRASTTRNSWPPPASRPSSSPPRRTGTRCPSWRPSRRIWTSIARNRSPTIFAKAEAMVEAAQKKNIIIQIGFQRRQSPALRQVRDYLQQGNLGRIVQVDAQIHYLAGLRDTTPQDPPASLDWDLWCGPAPKIPYSPQVGHFAWRLEKTTGHGHLVDWGIHLIDATRWILGATMPRSVQASGGIYYYKDKITTPDVLTVQFDFDACPVCWKHRIWGAQEYTPEVSNGIFFYGENGTIFVTDDRWVLIPKDKNKQREEHKASADMGTAHMAEFLGAVRSRQAAGLHDRGRLPLHRHRQARDDRLRRRRQDRVG